MAETLRIEIDDATRSNPLLDEFMGMGSAPAAGGAPTGPSFPATVRGSDGKQYGMAEYHKAADRAQNEADRNRAGQAYDAFFGENAPAFPATVMGPDGKRYDFKAYKAATARADREAKAKSADDAYKSLYGGPLTPPDTVKGADGRKYKSTEDYFKARDGGEKGGGVLDELLGHMGGNGIKGMMGAGGALGAAGIAGGILMAIGTVTSALQGMKRAVDGVTAGLDAAIQNQMPSGSDAANSIAEMESAIPIIGDAMAAQTQLMTSIVSMPEKLTQSFLERAKALAPYSAAISGSEAFADARTTMADLKEANELGPDMARMIDAQTDLQMEMRSLLLPIKKFVVEILADRLEGMATGVRIIANLPTIIETIAEAIQNDIIFLINRDVESVEEQTKLTRKILAHLLKPGEDDNPKDMFDDFIRDLNLPANQPA